MLDSEDKNLEHKTKAIDFINHTLIREVERLIELEFYYFSIVIMSQSIELLGSFLDAKPFKAREQSKIRFANALKKLFGKKYNELNVNHWLYVHLRNNLSHLFLTSSHLQLASNKQTSLKHLELNEGKIVILAENFFHDYRKACEKLIHLIKNDNIKVKKISGNFNIH